MATLLLSGTGMGQGSNEGKGSIGIGSGNRHRVCTGVGRALQWWCHTSGTMTDLDETLYEVRDRLVHPISGESLPNIVVVPGSVIL